MSDLWWVVRLWCLSLLLAAWWHSAHDDYRLAFHLLLGIFITYSITGAPPPLRIPKLSDPPEKMEP